MSLLKWEKDYVWETSRPVPRWVASVRGKYHFRIIEVLSDPDDVWELGFTRLVKTYLLGGFVIDNQHHTHTLDGRFFCLDDAMDAAEAALVTKKLEGVI